MKNWWRADEELMKSWWRADEELMKSWWWADDELMKSWWRAVLCWGRRAEKACLYCHNISFTSLYQGSARNSSRPDVWSLWGQITTRGALCSATIMSWLVAALSVWTLFVLAHISSHLPSTRSNGKNDYDADGGDFGDKSVQASPQMFGENKQVKCGDICWAKGPANLSTFVWSLQLW